MPKVETVTTVFTQIELAEALCKAHAAFFNSDPSNERLACAWAHNALECGRDAHGNIAHCRCFNLGNITIPSSSDVPFWSIVCAEQQRDSSGKLNGVWISTVMKFAAFSSLFDGAFYYWAFLAKRPNSLKAMNGGDGRAFGMALAADHYMTANPEPYATSLAHLTTEGLSFVKKLQPQPRDWSSERLAGVMNMIALTLDESIREGLDSAP